ncbi:MAG: hypothetical protein VBE63_11295 [Lamprobacter sp.]|uniref:hypothetical protein n=1 Tax=Lamprobacter sp. TaxID=3100796 RepID=UPI002B256817|nr:hypothetical protein [Lamprobacter sp.]MEA3640515.1 hypothetical protein [Lamprobacter sp.]
MSTAANPVRKAITLAALLVITTANVQAVGFGDMFNPGRWFSGNSNDDYYEGPWGPYGPGAYAAPGYAPYGGYGYAPYGTPGYGVPGAPYAAPPYGAPTYSAPAPTQPKDATSNPSDSAKDREIEALKQRIEQLESRNAPPSRPQPPRGQNPDEGWPSAPAFRPMDQY